MSPQRAEQLLEAGMWLQTAGDVMGARRLFEQALQLDPSNRRAQALLKVPAPEPLRPSSGRLAPDAQSAWDLHSSPGVSLTGRPGAGSAMDLVASDVPFAPSTAGTAVAEELERLLNGAKDLLELDDHTGAMELIEKAQALAPDDPRVRQLRKRSEQVLQAMFESKLGPLEAVPRVLLKEDEVIWLNLDHRAGFVLAQIDGTMTFEDVFAVSGMSRLDTARILAQLVEEGVISAGAAKLQR